MKRDAEGVGFPERKDDITHLFAGGITGLIAVVLFFVWFSEHIGG